MKRRLDELSPHPYNERVYGKTDLDPDLVASIRKMGLLEPLLVTADGLILSGHRRALAAGEAGVLEVGVVEFESTDRLDILEVIVEANRQRVKSNEQTAREARALLYVEEERAKQRRGRPTEKRDNFPTFQGRARDRVGEQLGMSGKQAERAAQVAEAIGTLEKSGREEEAASLRMTLNEKSIHAAHSLAKKNGYLTTKAKSPKRQPTPQYIKLSQWKELSPDEQAVVLGVPGSSRATFNAQKNASIEWAMWSWNPVTGCLHNCPYCYARDIAERFYKQKFDPAFLPERLSAPFNTKVPPVAEQQIGYKNVFTCSMADLFGRWVPQPWIDAVLGVVCDAPQWNFLFLTKFPIRLSEQQWPKNAWAGATVDTQIRVEPTMRAFRKVKDKTDVSVTWLSLEPLLEPLEFESLEMFDMVVIGGASRSNLTPEFIPPSSWYEQLLWQARKDGCAVYVKENLKYRPREYPGMDEDVIVRAPEAFFVK